MSDLSVGQRQGPGVFINYSPANAETRITGQQYTQQELYDIWNGWVKNAPPGNGEYRELAFGRLVDWLKEPSSNLDLRNLKLSSIPFIPPVPRCECLIIDMNTFRKLSHNEVEKESLQKSAENVLICTPPPDSENIRTFEVDLNDEKK